MRVCCICVYIYICWQHCELFWDLLGLQWWLRGRTGLNSCLLGKNTKKKYIYIYSYDLLVCIDFNCFHICLCAFIYFLHVCYMCLYIYIYVYYFCILYMLFDICIHIYICAVLPCGSCLCLRCLHVCIYIYIGNNII